MDSAKIAKSELVKSRNCKTHAKGMLTVCVFSSSRVFCCSSCLSNVMHYTNKPNEEILVRIFYKRYHVVGYSQTENFGLKAVWGVVLGCLSRFLFHFRINFLSWRFPKIKKER